VENPKSKGIFSVYFWSTGLLLMLVVAPLCWALLPLGYYNLKLDETIKANPTFLVFMRMLVGLVLTILLFILIAFRFILKRKWSLFWSICKNGWAGLRNRKVFFALIGLGTTYFFARFLEMKFILTKETIEGGATTSAIRDYGYFMGLMLALPLAAKYGIVGKISETIRRYFPGCCKSDEKSSTKCTWFHNMRARLKLEVNSVMKDLRLEAMTISGRMFFCCTLFLILGSGLLYISAKEPVCVWGYFWNMTWIAFCVALLSSFSTDAKTIGKIDISEASECEKAGFKLPYPAIIGSGLVNAAMLLITMGFALLFWMCTKESDGVSVGPLFSKMFASSKNFISMWILVGFFGTLIAPVAQLVGVYIHDKSKKDVSEYGVSGANWLQICAGFEPLFVVIVGAMLPLMVKWFPGLANYYDANSQLVSGILMGAAVCTVIVIALLKIGETWAEKSASLRNAVFASIRGSTQDAHENDPVDYMKKRAVDLSILKFYGKRQALSSLKLGCVGWMPLSEFKEWIPCSNRSPESFCFLLKNAQYFFAKDDPFTNDVLLAHEQYLRNKFRDVRVRSLRRYSVIDCNVGLDVWKNNIRPAAWKISPQIARSSMPYVIEAVDEKMAKACMEEWQALLNAINKIVTNGEITRYIDALLADFAQLTSINNLSRSTDDAQ